MMPPADRRPVRLHFVAGQPATFLEDVRRELQGGAAAVGVDLTDVDRLDSDAIRSLAAAVEIAQTAGAAVYCEGARPAVYKALHVAKLAQLLARAPQETG